MVLGTKSIVNSVPSYPLAISLAPERPFFSLKKFFFPFLGYFHIYSLINPGRSGSIKCPVFCERELAWRCRCVT